MSMSGQRLARRAKPCLLVARSSRSATRSEGISFIFTLVLGCVGGGGYETGVLVSRAPVAARSLRFLNEKIKNNGEDCFWVFWRLSKIYARHIVTQSHAAGTSTTPLLIDVNNSKVSAGWNIIALRRRCLSCLGSVASGLLETGVR